MKTLSASISKSIFKNKKFHQMFVVTLTLCFFQQASASSHKIFNINVYTSASLQGKNSDFPSLFSGGPALLEHFTVYKFAESASSYTHLNGGYVKEVVAPSIKIQKPYVKAVAQKNSEILVSKQRAEYLNSEMQIITQRLENLKTNTVFRIDGEGQLVIQASAKGLTVVSVAAEEMQRNILLVGSPQSLVVIKVQGEALTLLNSRTNLKGLKPEQVLVFSSEVKKATLKDSGPSYEQAANGLLGSWILPNATVDFSRALIVGHLMAKSIYTSVNHSGQVNEGCFKGLQAVGVGCSGLELEPPTLPPSQPPCTGTNCQGEVPLH